jgi:hypothetical protein
VEKGFEVMQVTSINDNVQSSDVKEDSIRTQMPHILDILLLDRTTSSPDKPQNIIWANDNYKELDADSYSATDQIRWYNDIVDFHLC